MTGYFSPDAARKAAQSVLSRAPRTRGFAQILRFGPPMVSLSALICAAPALAQTTPTTTTISSATTTPLVTSTSGNVVINAGGSVKPTSGVAVTVDSNNTVSNSGIIQFQNLDNVTGVLVLGGHTSTIDNTGTIQVDDTSTTTTDDKGIVHGPFAKGTNRYGIRATGPGDVTGDIINETVGVITVKGDKSAGISLETNLTGSIINGGGISIAGTDSYGIHTTGNVGGNVTLSGTISGNGQNVQGVNLGGDVGGQVVINGSLATSGYRYTTRTTDPNILKELAADDLLQSGATVTVGGSVAKGVLVDVAVTDLLGTVTGATGTVSSIAAAPAIVIGAAAGHNITLGNVGTGVDAYGLEIKGNVSGAGTYDGVTSTGVQLGLVGGGTVNTTGGVRISGSLVSSAYAADATALHLNSGVVAPVFRNEGGITAALLGDLQGATARAVVIEAGSNVTALQNANTITAQVSGQKGDAAAIIDRSGSLSEIENIGIIAAGRTLTDVTQAVTGKDVALDLSANTTGVHLIQSVPATGATLVPAITGSVTFGSGGDRVEILAGSVAGDVDLGSGANSLTIDNAATVKGALKAAGGTVALAVGTGTLQINNASQLSLTSLSLGAGSSLVVTADPSVGQATKLDVNGAATIASGAKIGLRLNGIQQGTTTYTLIRANQLTSGASDVSLLGSVPYLYTASLQTNAAAGTVSATLGLKSAQQLALPASSAGAYQAVIANVGRDKALESALLVQTNRDGLINLYNQLLPNHSGSVFNIFAASVGAFSKPLDDRQDPVGGGFWMQETNLGVFSNGKADDPGYKGWSFGAVAGYEIPKTPLGILGVTFGASTNQLYPDNTDAAEDLHATVFEGGVYWRATRGGFAANARLAGDYVKVTSDRVVEVLGGDGLAVSRTAAGRWNAFGFNAHALASYETRYRNYYFRPQASVDYVRFTEGSYAETGGGDGMDLAVASRTSSRLSAFAGVVVGALYGPDHSWGPEALVGYRAVASETLGVTNAKYVAGGDAYSLRADNLPGSGLAAHLALKGENGSGGFSVGAGAENRDGLNIYDLRLTGHVQF